MADSIDLNTSNNTEPELPAGVVPKKFVPFTEELAAMGSVRDVQPEKDYALEIQNYVSEEVDVKQLYEDQIRTGEELTPLSVSYYISNLSDRNNSDLQGAREEQKQIYELLMQNSANGELTKEEWEGALQSLSGWKEIVHAIKQPDFGMKTVSFLVGYSGVETINGRENIKRSLLKTALFIKSNLKQLNNGA